MYDKVNTPEFNGGLAIQLQAFLSEKRGLGYKYERTGYLLKQFDKFSMDYDCSDGLTKELALAWAERLPYQSRSTQESKITIIRQFAIFMQRNGYNACVLPKCNSTEFYRHKPCVYTTGEISRIFTAADSMESRPETPHRHLIFPLLFRVLYCCGLRISEALKLKVNDVNLESGVLEITDGKGNRDRLVPMDDELKRHCVDYYSLMRNNLSSDGYFFPSPRGGRYNHNSVYGVFRGLLIKSNISHGGRGKGPRVHDIRHTFAVHSFRRFISAGRDPMEILPVLAAYLGHKTYAGTSHYLHLIAEMFPEITSAVEEMYGDFIPAGGGIDETN